MEEVITKFLVAVEYAAQSQVEDEEPSKLKLQLQLSKADLVRISGIYLSDFTTAITTEEIESACASLFPDDGAALALEKIQTSAREKGSGLNKLLHQALESRTAAEKKANPKKKSLLNSLYSGKSKDGGNGEEEDDEDDEDEDAIKEKPILRGTLKLVDGILTWSGKWAMSAEKFSEGEKARFKYVFTGVKSDGEKVAQPKEVNPVSGKFSGSFMLKDESAPGGQIKVEETDVELTFTEPAPSKTMYDVVGKGRNNFGAFKLSGKYDPAKHRLAVEKEYEPPGDADFQAVSDGEDAEDEIEDDGDDIDKEAELAALKAEANLPVEELRKRYMNAAKEDGNDDKKRAKIE